MASHDGSGLVEFVVRSTVVSTEKPAEVIDESTLRIDGVLSNRGVVVVGGGVEYDNAVVAAVTLKTFTCDGIGARGEHGECRDRCGGGSLGSGVVKSVVAEVADVSMVTDESDTSTEEADVLLEDTEISTVVSTTVEGVADASSVVDAREVTNEVLVEVAEVTAVAAVI
ncbi:hypothetical protein HG530_012629 [Fusarium avenaceum]|nr:hypothetical protein HG530_012629 [Fusarium avenaceum]